MVVPTEGLGSVQPKKQNTNRPAASTYGGHPGSTGWVIEQISIYVLSLTPHTVDAGLNGTRVPMVPLKEYYRQMGSITEYLIKLEGRCKDLRMKKSRANQAAKVEKEKHFVGIPIADDPPSSILDAMEEVPPEYKL